MQGILARDPSPNQWSVHCILAAIYIVPLQCFNSHNTAPTTQDLIGAQK